MVVFKILDLYGVFKYFDQILFVPIWYLNTYNI